MYIHIYISIYRKMYSNPILHYPNPPQTFPTNLPRPHQARRAASNFIRRYSHASRPLTALDEGAALQVAKWVPWGEEQGGAP